MAALRALLARRPHGERWAVLLSSRRLDAVSPAPLDGVTVARLPFGCAGCLPAVPLRVAIARLVRAVRPVRLLVELDAPGHRDRAVALLGSDALADLVDLER